VHAAKVPPDAAPLPVWRYKQVTLKWALSADSHGNHLACAQATQWQKRSAAMSQQYRRAQYFEAPNQHRHLVGEIESGWKVP
jgi:hypothetical protein